MAEKRYVLKISCADRPGIVAAVSGALLERDCNIVEAKQFEDVIEKRFFMRVVFSGINGQNSLREHQEAMTPLAQRFEMDWSIRDCETKRRVMILVSRFDHCLVDILYRKRIGELPMDLTAVVTNHAAENYAHLDLCGAPLISLPVTAETKRAQEDKLLELIERTGTEVVVLARYMQVLSAELSARLSRRCINIHHSFLPGFKGAKPYHQAYERGVKLMGATAHYVTDDLDEGPIIEQDVERISHSDSPEDLVRKGRDIERRVLARALRYHLDDRVLLNGHKTVVFPD
ncbi:formyltetrahydrofolate deformylase [Methylorubrum extorquens]|uniref:Formyltetrahydrofolate deformylase n=3 Tax=Pseudomonadota TaxID=1224 RepID=A0A0U2VNC4_ECOLX|nr:formyltetrahydrofolate deformylase [Methylorubrum extorquens]ACK86417.1 formyltetrahydrofolate deformylase [Methylorubrum extorquens CM4]ALS39158.1 PurU [Escherichia coli]CAB39401.1 purU protein [Methylorubrum extorquens CM4]